MKRDFLEDRKRIQSAGKINTRLRKENDGLKEKVNLFCCHFINTIFDLKSFKLLYSRQK